MYAHQVTFDELYECKERERINLCSSGNVLGNKEKAKEMIIKSKQKKVPVLDFGYGKLIIRTNEHTKDLISKIRKKLNGK